MKSLLHSVSFLACAAAFLVGCQPTPLPKSASATPAADVVATVDEQVIRVDDLNAAMAKRLPALSGGRGAEALRQQVLDELIREKALLLQARRAGLDRDPELLRRWDRMVVAKYEATHKPDAEKLPPPSTAEVDQYFREHSAEYHRPERIRVALIQINGSLKATDTKRAELRARAENILALAQKPDANFSELARLNSEDRATRYSGGSGGWMERGQASATWPRELVEAAFALESPGVLSSLVQAGGNFYVLKLLDREPAGTRSLEEVRGRIVHQLKERHRVAAEDRFYAEQRTGLTIEVNQAALQTVPLSTPAALAKAPGAPPSLPE